MKDNTIILEYQKSKNPALLEQIILEYGSLVKTVAGRLSLTLGDYFEMDDLVSFGTFGLIDAIGRYNADLNTTFETYASLRIRGTILDEVRKYDAITRTVKDHKKMLSEARAKLTAKSGRAEPKSIAEELGISLDDYYKWEYEAEISKPEIFDHILTLKGDGTYECDIPQTTFEEPEDIIDRFTKDELVEHLNNALDCLTEKERLVIQLFYYENLRQNEIAEVMEVSVSRVSQLHANAIVKMRKEMGQYEILLEDTHFF